MSNFDLFLDRLGTLHDCRILRLEWNLATKTLTVLIDDIYSNFEGLPEYPGASSGEIEFFDVSDVAIYFEPEDILWIYEIINIDSKAQIRLVPGGSIDISYGGVSFPELSHEFLANS